MPVHNLPAAQWRVPHSATYLQWHQIHIKQKYVNKIRILAFDLPPGIIISSMWQIKPVSYWPMTINMGGKTSFQLSCYSGVKLRSLYLQDTTIGPYLNAVCYRIIHAYSLISVKWTKNKSFIFQSFCSYLWKMTSWHKRQIFTRYQQS